MILKLTTRGHVCMSCRFRGFFSSPRAHRRDAWRSSTRPREVWIHQDCESLTFKTLLTVSFFLCVCVCVFALSLFLLGSFGSPSLLLLLVLFLLLLLIPSLASCLLCIIFPRLKKIKQDLAEVFFFFFFFF